MLPDKERIMFIDRKNEMQLLESSYSSDHAELFVLYGRRRVGKTELLREFCKGKPHIFFIATLSTDKEQLANFSQQVYAFMHPDVPDGFTYPSWEAALRALSDLPDSPRPILIMDEFTYLISGNKAIPSILQKVWDEKLKNSQIFLALCGSFIGMMETEVLSFQAPLYGRRTASIFLLPLELSSISQFFSEYSSDEQFLTWAVLGGMPYYLRIFNGQKDLFTNIREQILDPQTGALFDEPRLLLMEELREPRNYFSILRAIAQGHTRLNEITQFSGVGESNMVSRYLDILQQMRLITRRVPVTESQPEKSKKGLYQINDHFLRFWFRYVHPNLTGLDLGLANAILGQRIRPDMDHFAAPAFEEASRKYVANLARKGELRILPDRIGSWWNREAEIDVVAISEENRMAHVAECKWSINKVGVDVLNDLKRKAQIMMSESEIRDVEYALFSRRGFTAEVQELAGKEDIRLVTVDQIVHQW
jgi:AAA+ ATPase superfamily predicted ATPase